MLEWWAVVPAEWQLLGILSVVAIGVAYAVAELAARLARVALASALDGLSARQFSDPVVRKPIRATRAVVFVAVLVLTVRPVLTAAGMALPLGLGGPRASQWLFESGPRVLIVGVIAYVLVQAISLLTTRWEKRLGLDVQADGLEQAKRARTVASLVRNVLISVVSSLAALTILRELGLDILPIVTGAGILGLAVGFGAQTLVRDIISGFFLIFENNLRVGDVAVIDGTGGVVERINLRTTVLRDLEGTVHVFPNGSFERFSNRTKDFSYYVIDVGVAYKEDTDRVSDVLRGVGALLHGDPAVAANVLAPLEVLGVDAFEDSQVTIKVRIKTVPLKQWEVGRELRRRIKQAFDREGIEIPFPHVSLYVGEASRPWRVEQVPGPGRSDSPEPTEDSPT
ncbi:MAG TPA: mechanosensitive ion channel family protein [Vicinamibacterales bacterium]|nr:mechanosensitive ion channel family protein [Vicinamibacterales bacterium]